MAPLNLTEEMLERIIYGMENQRDVLVIDPESGDLRPGEETVTPGIPLPDWSPTDGYQLMNRFAATLANPVYRERLHDALRSGHGVFRRFKNELKERPEIERLWRRFKKAEMRKRAVSWLTGYSEMVRLEGLGEAPDDIDDLPLTDFTIRPCREGETAKVREYDSAAIIEEWPGIPPDERRVFVDRQRGGRTPGSAEETLLVATDPSENVVGFAWASIETNGEHRSFRLQQIFVLPAFRGLGLGSLLVRNLLERIDAENRTVWAEIPEGKEFLIEILKESGFSPVSTTWRQNRRNQS